MIARRREDEDEPQRRPIKFSPRVRISVAVGALVIGGLVVWGTLPDDDDDDDRDDDRQTEQVQQYEDED